MNGITVCTVSVATLRQWLGEGGEVALLDVREHGQYGAGHLFYAVNLPYSQLEYNAVLLLPRFGGRVVVYDQLEGVAEQAQQRLYDMGYTQVFVLEGGLQAWQQAGHNVFTGVNVASKTFGELVEQQCHTPSISATSLAAYQATGEPLLLMDGRPWEEYHKKTIPGAVCCPNGELALRASTLQAQSGATRLVVNCAGRTRSIIGAQTLINLGLPYDVVALENGTQGWFLEGLELEHGAMRHGETQQPDRAALMAAQQQAKQLATQVGVMSVDAEQVQHWLAQMQRTTYLFDVRTAAEYQQQSLLGALHAPGGQLVQATDHYMAVRGARVVLWDDKDVRSWVTASWLRQMGWEVYVLAAGAGAMPRGPGQCALPWHHYLPQLSVEELVKKCQQGPVQLLDLRSSQQYRRAHLAQAQWSIRPRLRETTLQGDQPVVVIADQQYVASLAASELAELGIRDVYWHQATPEQWREAGLAVEASPDVPTDAQCIDYVFFAHDRHEGNLQAARQYLAWETNLLKQVDMLELQYFTVYVAP